MKRLLSSLVVILLCASCAKSSRNPAALTEGSKYHPRIKSSEFVSKIDNPYYPLRPGTTYRYEGEEEGEKQINTVEVTKRKREILGVQTTVVLDQVFVHGELTESTYDWFAQDRDGNVWYFGEDTKEYENGKVSTTKGSWEAGVDGAQPGIIMLASPRVGDAYFEEYYKGEAEDNARITKIGGSEKVKVPYGSFDELIITENRSPLEPKVVEQKFYARGVGMIQEGLLSGGKEISRLVAMER
jgi:hypothetical protein